MSKEFFKQIFMIGLILIIATISFGCSNSSAGKEEIVKKDADFINKNNFSITPLIITFKKAELHNTSSLSNEEKIANNIPQDTQYYVDIEYGVKNPTSSMYGWNGFNKMLLDGEQINIGSENFGEVKGNEIEANATIKNNSIKIPASKITKQIKLLPAKPLKDNTITGDEPTFNPSPITINLK